MKIKIEIETDGGDLKSIGEVIERLEHQRAQKWQPWIDWAQRITEDIRAELMRKPGVAVDEN